MEKDVEDEEVEKGMAEEKELECGDGDNGGEGDGKGGRRWRRKWQFK